MKPSLQSLLQLAHEGDRYARDEVFSFLRTRFIALAKYRLIGTDDVEDVVQETMITVDQRFDRLRDVASLLAYTDAVMRHKIGNYYSVTEVRKRHVAPLDEKVPEPQYVIERELESAQLGGVVREAIERLRQERRRCGELLRGLCEGLSVVELGERFGMSRRYVDDWLYHCRKALKRILEDEFGYRS